AELAVSAVRSDLFGRDAARFLVGAARAGENGRADPKTLVDRVESEPILVPRRLEAEERGRSGDLPETEPVIRRADAPHGLPGAGILARDVPKDGLGAPRIGRSGAGVPGRVREHGCDDRGGRRRIPGQLE